MRGRVSEWGCVCVCVNQAQRTQAWLCACVDGSLCASCGCVWACAWSQVDECVPVGACSNLDIRPQLVHHRARHEGEKGGTTVCEDLCLICCVLSRLSTGMHAADLQNFINSFTYLPCRTRI